MKKFIKVRATTGTSRNIRSRIQKVKFDSKEGSEHKTVFGVATLSSKESSSLDVEFGDRNESQTATGRTDDCAEESIVSSRIDKQAVLNGIGKMKKISLVTSQVALKEGFDVTKFTFPRSWTTPRTVLKLSAGPLALRNIAFFVADVDFAV